MSLDDMQKYATEHGLELVSREHWEAMQKVAALGLALQDLPEGCALMKHKDKFLIVCVTSNDDGIELVGKVLDGVLKEGIVSIGWGPASDNAESSCEKPD